MADVPIGISVKLENIEKSTSQIERFARESEGAIKRVEDSVKDVGKSTSVLSGGVFKAAAAFTAFNQGIEILRKVADVFAEPIRAAIEQENAVNELNTALAISGQFSREASEGMQAFAEELQKTTKFEDDQVLSASALLQSLNRLDEEGLKQATQASVDLASALGVGLEQGARLVSGALKDGTVSMRGVSIAFQKGATDAETFSNVMKGLGDRFGGAAAAQVLTFSGGLANLSHSFSDVKENVGNLIVQNEAVIAVMHAVTAVVQDVAAVLKSDVIPAIGPLLTEAILVTTAALGGFLEIAVIIEREVRRAIVPVQVLIEVLSALAGSISAFKKGDFSALFEIKDDAIKSIKTMFTGVEEGALITGRAKNRFDELATSIFEAGNREFGTKTNAQLEKMSQRAREARDALGVEIPEGLKKLQEKFKNAGLDRLAVLQKEKEESLKLASTFSERDIRLAGDVAKIKAAIARDFDKKITEEREKTAKESRDRELKEFENQRKRISALASGDVTKIITELQLNAKLGTVDISALSASFVKTVAEGAKGASKLVSAAVGAAAEVFLPGAGQAAAEIAEVLSQGPEKVKEMIDSFLGAIPQMLLNIANSIPVILKSIATNLPSLIVGILTALPQIVNTLIQGAVDFVFAIIERIPEIVTSIVNHIPLIITRLLEGLGDVLSRIVERAPEVITALVAALPRVIDSLIALIPNIINAIVQNLPLIVQSLIELMPQVAIGFTIELVKNIPKIIKAIVVGLGKAFVGILKGIGQAFVGILKGIGDALGIGTTKISVGGGREVEVGKASDQELKDFVEGIERLNEEQQRSFKEALGAARAERAKRASIDIDTSQFENQPGLASGGVIPGGFSNDTFRARLSSGEAVVPRDTTSALADFLSRQQASNGTDAKLDELIRAVSSDAGRPVAINLRVGENDLANILLNLNRQGFRVAA